MEPLLHVRDLTVCYGSDNHQPIVAVERLSFDLARGEAVGWFGESGCGKTTLGLALLGLLPGAGHVKSGSINLMEVDLLRLNERQMQKIRGAQISMIYQEPGMALNPVLSVGDQIAEVLRAHKPLSRTRAQEEVGALLAEVGLGSYSGISKAYPHQLSGGEKQRVVIAQAIACRPALIIADEPASALDVATQTKILALLKTLQTKFQIALLLISHDPSAFENVVDRIFVMYAGRLVEEGPACDLLLEPLHPYTRALLRTWPAKTRVRNRRRVLPVIPGEPPNPALLPVGCAFESRCPDARDLCRSALPEESRPVASRRVACFNYAH